MADDQWMTTRFEAARPRLRSVALRMLGSESEADDAVQDTWLRFGGTDRDRLDNVDAWLTTVAARICLDRLRARRARREDVEGRGQPHLERPTSTSIDDPAERVVLADSVSAALMIVLDVLAPAERVAFVLHDVFAVPFDDIAPIVDRSVAATRQLASRARRRVQGRTPLGDLDPFRQRQVVEAFLHAAHSGDVIGLLRLLDTNVVLQPDASALQMGSLTELHGAAAVASALTGGAKGARLAIVDGLAGLVWAPHNVIRGVIEFTVIDGRIASIDVTGDAARLARLDVVALDER